MKKASVCLLLFTIVSASIKAQLSGSKWKGILQLDNPVNVSFDFGKDTLTVVNLDEGVIIETMTYTTANGTFTLTKVSGQSECNNSTPGKYKYEIKDKTLSITLIEDACNDRAPYLKDLKLAKSTTGT